MTKTKTFVGVEIDNALIEKLDEKADQEYTTRATIIRQTLAKNIKDND